jgi:hypothetical protein
LAALVLQLAFRQTEAMRDALMEQAEKLVDAAWDAIEEDDTALASASAHEALSLSPEALDAWVILASLTATPSVRIALLREAVAQGKRLLAAQLKAYRQTSFWLATGTRPYMRAVHSLAVELWDRDIGDDRAHAVEFVRHLLRINPNDNQGVRFLAYGWIPLTGSWDELTRLLRRYRNETRTETRYSLALDAFRRKDAAAGTALAAALETNPHVPAFLLARRAPFLLKPETVTYGSQAEAQTYAALAFPVWRLVPGATKWLNDVLRCKPLSKG